MNKTILATAGALLLILLATVPVFADQVYHSERLDFALTPAGDAAGHPELRHGQVVNIHPNGPVIGALERYMVNGAMPKTSYDVRLEAFGGGCGGPPALIAVITTLETNNAGSAHGQGFFSADDLAGFSGATVGAQWTLVSGGVDAYQTACTTVVID